MSFYSGFFKSDEKNQKIKADTLSQVDLVIQPKFIHPSRAPCEKLGNHFKEGTIHHLSYVQVQFGPTWVMSTEPFQVSLRIGSGIIGRNRQDYVINPQFITRSHVRKWRDNFKEDRYPTLVLRISIIRTNLANLMSVREQ